MIELVVTVNVGRIFLYRVFHLQNGRVFTGLGVEHPDTADLFHREVDVLEDFLAFAASTESHD